MTDNEISDKPMNEQELLAWLLENDDFDSADALADAAVAAAESDDEPSMLVPSAEGSGGSSSSTSLSLAAKKGTIKNELADIWTGTFF